MGESTQTIQRQRDQPVIGQVPDEGKAERETTVRVWLLELSLPSRGLESPAACLACSLKCDAEMGLGAAWGPGSSGDKRTDAAVPGGNERRGLMPMLKALGGI